MINELSFNEMAGPLTYRVALNERSKVCDTQQCLFSTKTKAGIVNQLSFNEKAGPLTCRDALNGGSKVCDKLTLLYGLYVKTEESIFKASLYDMSMID